MAAICAGFGPAYMRESNEAGEPPTELWEALASRGFLGVNLPEQYGGGGLGMSALAAVGEEISAAGCSLLLIVVSPAIVGSILVRHGTTEQQEDVAARHRRGHDARRVRDHRARRRLELAQDLDGGASARTAATRCAGRRRTSPASRTRTRSSSSRASGWTTATLGLPMLFLVDTDAPGLERQHIPTALRAADKQWQLFLDDVEVPAERLVGARDRRA